MGDIGISHMVLRVTRLVLVGAFIFLLCSTAHVFAASSIEVVDSDHDGLQDHDELRYGTDPLLKDTDGDGFSDWIEARNGYTPLAVTPSKLIDADFDLDGYSDSYELSIGTNPAKKDTDGDGYSDRKEVEAGYDPRSSSKKKLQKKIEIVLSQQRLRYYLGDIMIGSARVSTGKQVSPTPIGEFRVVNKSDKAWSNAAKLWMPYWMGLGGDGIRYGKYGIHELPEWPGGKKEGENHLGTPVSGGCIRLGVGAAKMLYDWTPVGTKIIISKT